MALYKHAYPILEHDDEKNAVIMPGRGMSESAVLPEICVMTFFGEVLGEFVTERGAQIAAVYKSEMGDFPVYTAKYKDVQICLMQATVGSASIAMMSDFVIGQGVKTVIACGSCGVLADIPAGDVIVPAVALRDEGASYHYLPPSRDIEIDLDVVSTIENVLEKEKVPYIKCKTWTTDAFYRETADMIAYRMEEGCKVVEMECATMAAVAKFRGAKFGQLLYSGDILADVSAYDDRDWYGNITARKKLLYLALEVSTAL